MPLRVLASPLVLVLLTLATGCPPPVGDGGIRDGGNDGGPAWQCTIGADEDVPPFAASIGCFDDYRALASDPVVETIPGAQSMKTVIDRVDDNRLYFQNTKIYPIHWEFASAHLSGGGRPVVPDLGQFNAVEYYSPDRRFLLGAITYFAQPDIFAYEISPYDTASLDMIQAAFDRIRQNAYFGDRLRFHPTSQAVANRVAGADPDALPVVTTDELFADIDYQPLNLAESIGKLRFVNAAALDTTYLSFRDIVVLDRVPNDISVVSGIITQEFQTPLSHINVLSQNRGTPNMGLRGAVDNETLRALEGKWVRLDVGALQWTVEEATQQEADAWWEEHRPDAVQVPNLDLDKTGLWDMADVLDPNLPLKDAIKAVIPAFGGKASHYAALAQVPDVPVPPAFVIPVFYYAQFMEQNGFDDQVDALLSDPDFLGDAATRDVALAALRDAMKVAPVDADFEALLTSKLATDFPGQRMRFRSSTNAEDLEGFTGAGLYTSKSGDPGDPTRPVLDAVRKVWASVWFFRAFEERSYRSIDHRQVGMALLVHRSFPSEDANGVALTANPFDPSGIEPGFYINVQEGGASVVKPDPGVTTDQFIYQYDLPGQPIIFLGHSNQVPAGETVLTTSETYTLGTALKAIHTFFYEAYGPAPGAPPWYAMDVEFKFDTAAGETESKLWVKQARPHPGRGQ